MTKEKFAYAFDYASMWVFGALICAVLSVYPLLNIYAGSDLDINVFFFVFFAVGAIASAVCVALSFREGMKNYDEEQAREEARARYYASRAPRRVLAVSAVAAVAAANPDGFTVNAYTGETPAEGYAVALAETQDSHDAEGLARVLDLIQSGSTRATCVGGWLDSVTGRYYYDATILVSDRAEAEALGRANGQIAIFCLDTCEEIRL